MPAYILAEIEITDPAGYKEYTQLVPATIEKFGGRFLHRGGPVSALEGEWAAERRRVILEFPTPAAAREWWDSTEYAKPKEMRRASSNGRLMLFEGL